MANFNILFSFFALTTPLLTHSSHLICGLLPLLRPRCFLSLGGRSFRTMCLLWRHISCAMSRDRRSGRRDWKRAMYVCGRLVELCVTAFVAEAGGLAECNCSNNTVSRGSFHEVNELFKVISSSRVSPSLSFYNCFYMLHPLSALMTGKFVHNNHDMGTIFAIKCI